MSVTSIQPPHKAEAWKFTPKVLLTKAKFLTPANSSVEDSKNANIALGPTPSQFQTLSFSELEEEGYVSLKETKITEPDNSNTKRAVLDQTIQNLYGNNPSLEVTVLKTLPGTLWISPQESLRSLSFIIPKNVEQSICLLEAKSEEKTSSGFLFHFDVAESASLELGMALNIERPSLSKVIIEAHGKSEVNTFTLLSGDVDYKRVEVNLFQNGKESNVSLNGLCFTKNTSVLEYQSNAFHLNKNQNTTQIFKTICSDKGKVIFGGRIHLTEGTTGAAVEQLNNNLIIGAKASVDTQPELNIYHDDVKASHGATTSTIDDNHLFYFASRGFSLKQSKKMLLEAFCKSAFDNLSNKGLIEYFSDALTVELENVES